MKNPTEKQLIAIEAEGNLVITAKPGSGKTFTIIEKIKKNSESLCDYQGIIAISFTQKASSELRSRAIQRGISTSNSFFGTLDGFYIGEIIMPYAKFLTQSIVPLVVSKLNDFPEFKKLEILKTKSVWNKNDEDFLIYSLSEGHIFLETCGELACYILKTIPEAIEYLKSRYTYIFIDEYQDCGEVQHEIFLTLIQNGIEGIAVGDLNQAIYAFAGRFSKYLQSLICDPRFFHVELDKNHRCHESISKYSLQLLGIDQKYNGEKRVFKVNIRGNEENIISAISEKLPQIKMKYNIQNNNEIAILCRTNGTAHKCHELMTLPSKLFVDSDLDNSSTCWARFFCDLLNCYYDPNIYYLDFLEKYLSEEYNHHIYLQALELVQNIFGESEDMLKGQLNNIVELAKIIFSESENFNVVSMLSNILNSTEKLTSFKPALPEEVCILTLHKSKGLEYRVVFLMDTYKFILPFEECSQEEYIQSLNLHYVGITRAIDSCYIMQGTLRYRSRQNNHCQALESSFLQLPGLQALRHNVEWTIEPDT